MVMEVSESILIDSSPSIERKALLFLSLPTERVIIFFDGKTILLFTRECGHIGVTTKHDLSGLRTGPPAAIDYAVEPVGVETIIPSALLEVTSLPSQETFMSIKRAKSPLETTASFRQ